MGGSIFKMDELRHSFLCIEHVTHPKSPFAVAIKQFAAYTFHYSLERPNGGAVNDENALGQFIPGLAVR